MGMLVLVQTNQGLTVNFAYFPIESPYCSYSWFYHRVPVISTKSPFNPIKSLLKKNRFQTAWNHPLRVTISKASGIVVVLLGVQLGLLNAARWQQPGTVADAQRTVAPLWVTVGMIMGLQLVEWEN